MKRSESCCSCLGLQWEDESPAPPSSSNLSCDGPSSPSASSWVPHLVNVQPKIRPGSEERNSGCSSLPGQHSQPSSRVSQSHPESEALMSLCAGSGKAAMPARGIQLPPARWALPGVWKPRSDPLCLPCWPLAGFSAASFHYHMQLPDVFHTLRVSQPCTTLGTSSLVFSLPSVNWGMIMCYRFWSQIG